MLNGQIQILHHFLVVSDFSDECIIKLFRIEIQHSYPADAFDFLELLKEHCQTLLSVDIGAVSCGVLSYHNDLRYAAFCQDLRFFQDVLHGSASVFSADLRNDAVGAEVAAALRDSKVRRLTESCGEDTFPFIDSFFQVIDGHNLLSGFDELLHILVQEAVIVHP